MARLVIDNKEIEAKEGVNLLQAAIDNGVYIPNLCFLKEMDKPPTSCRLCFVEIEGEDKPVTSCSVNVRDGMAVRTDTPEVRRLQKTAFELLLSAHRIECKGCSANKKCELQKIAKFLRIPLKQKRIKYLEREIKAEDDHPYLKYDPFKCVMCGRCTFVCQKKHGTLFLSFAKRGLNMTISFYGETDPKSIPCGKCFACVDICPVAALTKKVDS